MKKKPFSRRTSKGSVRKKDGDKRSWHKNWGVVLTQFRLMNAVNGSQPAK